jgi:RNA polymerase sigma-70 factor (ECF subfamily)
VAIAELDGPAVGLARLEPLALTSYTPWHAARADLLRRLDRREEARAAYDAAIATSGNLAERAWLAGRRDSL